MSAVPSSLSQWTESKITELYNNSISTSITLRNFLSEKATIVLNENEVTSDELLKQFEIEKVEENMATVRFRGSVEVSTNKSVIVIYFLKMSNKLIILMAVVQSGAVGLFFTVAITENDLTLGKPSMLIVNGSINVVYVCDLTLLFL
jgi:hypothetical protein